MVKCSASFLSTPKYLIARDNVKGGTYCAGNVRYWSVPLAGGTPTNFDATVGMNSKGMRASGEYVYRADSACTGSSKESDTTTITRVRIDGSEPPVVLAVLHEGLMDMRVQGDYLYLLDFSKLQRIAK